MSVLGLDWRPVLHPHVGGWRLHGFRDDEAVIECAPDMVGRAGGCSWCPADWPERPPASLLDTFAEALDQARGRVPANGGGRYGGKRSQLRAALCRVACDVLNARAA